MKALLLKELRQLSPIAWFWIGLIVIGYLSAFASSRLDQESLSSWCDSYCQPGIDFDTAVILIVLYLITAYSLFPREHDESTIDFLHALPVSRLTIFIAKFSAAWLLLFSISVLGVVLDGAILSFNPQSIDGLDYPRVRLTLLLRESIFAFVILSIGIFVSRFRMPGLVLYAIYLLLLMWVESEFGSTGVFNVFSMMDNTYNGQTLQLHWKAIGFHVLVAAILLYFSFRLWNNEQSRQVESKTQQNRPRWIAVVSTIGMFVAMTLAMSYQFLQHRIDSAGDGTATERTTYYRFVYPEIAESTFTYIRGFADTDYVRLHTLLGGQTKPKIQVDLTAESEHASGLAKWKKINMDLTDSMNDNEYRRVLSHETAHVFQAIESDRALSENFSAVRFFVEGMAQHTSFTIVKDEATRQLNWHLAAVAWHRQKIDFSDLLDDISFTQKFDAELYYTLGDTWTDALVQTCGPDVLGEFLRATGRPGAPLDLPAGLFWRTTLQSIDCELDAVNSTWRRQMTALFSASGDAEFPILSSVVSKKDTESGRIIVTAVVEPSSPGLIPDAFYIRVRSNTQFVPGIDSTFAGQVAPHEETGLWQVTYSLPRRLVQRERFELQLGYRVHPDSRIYFDRWQSGALN